MSRSELVRCFRRVYRGCSRRDIDNLVSAVLSDKYWSVQPGAKDAVYVVALTRAEFPLGQDFQSRVTHLGFVKVAKAAARYCRRGRVLATLVDGSDFKAVSVINWPAFLSLMRLDPSLIYHALKQGGLPPFIGKKELAQISRELKTFSGEQA